MAVKKEINKKQHMLEKIDNSITKLDIIIGAISILLIVVIISINVIMRAIANVSFEWVEEISIYIMLWAAFICAGLAVRTNGHVRIDVIYDLLPERAKRWANICIYFVCGIITGVLTLLGTRNVIQLIKTGQKIIAFDWMPLYIISACMPLGGAFMAYFYFRLIWINIKSKDSIKGIKTKIQIGGADE